MKEELEKLINRQQIVVNFDEQIIFGQLEQDESAVWSLFPKYCYGLFKKGEQKLITGSGLGEHTIPIRIANPRELVVISCKPKRK